jgi:hypothetical protein
MQDAADYAAIIHSLFATYVSRQMRLNPSPLILAQPKQVPSHRTAPNHRSKANQQPIQPATLLLSLSPSSSPLLLPDLSSASKIRRTSFHRGAHVTWVARSPAGHDSLIN